MLGLLYQHNHRNRMAFEYMLAYVLQQRDLERFMKYYPLGKHCLLYTSRTVRSRGGF